MTATDCATAGGVWGGANTTCTSAPPTSDIPTLSEWGLIIFSLLILSLATVVVVRRRMTLAPAGAVAGGEMSSMSGPMIVPALFWKTLVIVETLAVAVLLVIIAAAGSVPLRDIAGTLISAAIAAYIVHLWILSSRAK
jgi:hypothetical protein